MAIKIANGPRKVGNFNHSVIRAFWNKQHWTARATLQRCAAAWKGYYWSQESGNLNNFSKRKKQNKTKPPARCLSSSQRTKKVTEGNRSTWKPSWQQLDEAWGREGITATQLRTKLNWRERERGGGEGRRNCPHLRGNRHKMEEEQTKTDAPPIGEQQPDYSRIGLRGPNGGN